MPPDVVLRTCSTRVGCPRFVTTVERGGDERENCSDQDESGHHSVRGNSSDGNTRLTYRLSGQDSTPVHTVILYPCYQCYYKATTKQYLHNSHLEKDRFLLCSLNDWQ